MRHARTSVRLMWVVMIRVTEQANWCAHGPFSSFNDARDYDHGLKGMGMDRQIVRLTDPWKSRRPQQEQQK